MSLGGIAGQNIASGGVADGNTAASNSVAPVSGQVCYIWVFNVQSAPPPAPLADVPTLSGTGGFNVTWTQVATSVVSSADDSRRLRLTLFRGIPSSATAGVVTAAFGGNNQKVAYLGVDTYTFVNSASNQGVVQNGTNTNTLFNEDGSGTITVTLNPLASGANGVLFLWCLYATETTPTYNFTGTGVDSRSSTYGMMAAVVNQQGNRIPNVTVNSSGEIAAIAIEITATSPVGAMNGDKAVNAALTQSGAMFLRTINFGVGGDPLFASCGPTAYPVNDPSGRAAAEDTVGQYLPGIGYWPLKTQKSNTIGSSTPPSQIQGRNGYLRGIVLPLTAGAHVVTINMKTELDTGIAYRPQFIVKANNEVGLHADVTATAIAGTDWQTLTCSFTTTSDGAVEILRYKRGPDHVRLWWDNLTVS